VNPGRLRSLLGGFATAVAALSAACSRPGPSAGESAPPARVHMATVRIVTVPVAIEVAGTIRPVRHALLAARVMGAIEELPVGLGQRVRTGDLLIKISAGEMSARVAQAEAQLAEVKGDLDRERALLAKGASTPETVRSLEDRFALSQALMREAETMFGYTTLRAPFDGVIARKLADVGDFASPGQPLLEIEGTDAFEVDAGIPDSLAESLTVGTPLAIEIPASGLKFSGPVAELSSAADVSTHSVTAKISVAGAAVHSGQFARVFLPGPPARMLLAPGTAVTALGQMQRVFVAGADNRAVLRLVKTGSVHDGRVEILSGLDDGERVVVDPPAGLREGQRLEMLP